MNKRFYEIVKKGWELKDIEQKATYIDEVFVGAFVSVMVDNNYSMLDINSDGNVHYFMFENLDTKERIKLTVVTVPNTVPEIETIGGRAYIVVSYGKEVDRMFNVFKGLKYEIMSSKLSNIGSITFDYDNYFLYVNCPLYILIDDYVDFRTLKINFEKLSNDFNIIISSLGEYLKARMEAE